MDEAHSMAAESRSLVSVLVLSYRNFDGIWNTLHSILAQDYPNIEVIISDDGSDGFEAIAFEARNYISENNRGNITHVDIYSLPCNQGTVRNANAAVRRAHGRFVKTISPDDCFASNDAISRYVDFMLQDKCLVAFAKLRGVDDSGKYIYKLASCEDDYDSLKKMDCDQILNKLYARNFLPGAAEFFDRDVFERYGLFPENVRLIEDYSYWLLLASKGVRFGFLDEVLIDYRLSGVSSSGHYGEMFMKDMYVIYNDFIFPNDRRFGPLQPVYNALKKWGLDYYMTEARFDDLPIFDRAVARVKYFPLWCFTKIQGIKISLTNA